MSDPPSDEHRARIARVEAALGDGRQICTRCGATLETYADACTGDLGTGCPGFEAIEAAGEERPGESIDELIERLCATGLCWYLTHYQSLDPDPELAGMPTYAAPRDHFQCCITLDLDSGLEGWGPTAEAAMEAVLRQYRQ